MQKAICKKHGICDHKSQANGFDPKGKRRKNRLRCVQCLRERQKKVYRKKKEFLVEKLGGKCALCGYLKCNGSLDFHHIDRTTKFKNISQMLLRDSYEKCLLEANKCVLLCRNCHGEFESGHNETVNQLNEFLIKSGENRTP